MVTQCMCRYSRSHYYAFAPSRLPTCCHEKQCKCQSLRLPTIFTVNTSRIIISDPLFVMAIPEQIVPHFTLRRAKFFPALLWQRLHCNLTSHFTRHPGTWHSSLKQGPFLTVCNRLEINLCRFCPPSNLWITMSTSCPSKYVYYAMRINNT